MLRGNRRQQSGIIVSDHMDKTVVVRVERRFRHPLFERVIRRHKKYKAHDEINECRIGDTVIIEETRPLSKTKNWRVAKILTRAK